MLRRGVRPLNGKLSLFAASVLFEFYSNWKAKNVWDDAGAFCTDTFMTPRARGEGPFSGMNLVFRRVSVGSLNRLEIMTNEM